MTKGKSGKNSAKTKTKPSQDKSKSTIPSSLESESEPTFGMTDDVEDAGDQITMTTPVPEKKPVKEPVKTPPQPTVPLAVFLKIAGRKWDQMAGFKSYAKTHNLGPRTVLKWREEFQKFNDMPTK